MERAMETVLQLAVWSAIALAGISAAALMATLD
jgi:hypothetical protein